MFVQIHSRREFTVPAKDVIKVIRNAEKEPKMDSFKLPNRAVVEMVTAKAKKLIKQYPNEFEPWGVDAIEKPEVKKAKNSKPYRSSEQQIT